MRIESVEKRASGTAKVAVGGSSFLFREAYLEALGLDAQGLISGADFDDAAIDILAMAAAATEAEKKALALLARAEQSRFLLMAKLERRECGSRAARLALDFLEKEGLLDDRRFALAWLRSKMRAALPSPSKLMLGLRNRGIEEGLAKSVFAEVFGADERHDLLKRAAEKEAKRSGGDLKELRSALLRLGFKPGEIREYFEKDDD